MIGQLDTIMGDELYQRPSSSLDVVPGVNFVFPDHSARDFLRYGIFFPNELAQGFNGLREAVLRRGTRGVSMPHRNFLAGMGKGLEGWAKERTETAREIFNRPATATFAEVADIFAPALKEDLYNAIITQDLPYARSVVRTAELMGGRVEIFDDGSQAGVFVHQLRLGGNRGVI